MTDLEMQFNEDMSFICREARKIGYNPKIFAAMVGEYGGLATAKKLVMQDKPTDGYIRLFELNRLDLTAERFVIEPKYKDLFTEDEIHASRKRLVDYGFKGIK